MHGLRAHLHPRGAPHRRRPPAPPGGTRLKAADAVARLPHDYLAESAARHARAYGYAAASLRARADEAARLAAEVADDERAAAFLSSLAAGLRDDAEAAEALLAGAVVAEAEPEWPPTPAEARA